MAKNFVDVPRGVDAFASDRPVADEIRVAQLLAMGIHAFGSPAQVAALFSEAAEIGTPNLAIPRRRESSEFDDLPESQRALDLLTGDVAASARENLRAVSALDQLGVDALRVALWQEVERSRSPGSLVAFANYLVHEADGLDRVAAAAVLAAVPDRDYSDARDVLLAAREGHGRAAELASASLGDGGFGLDDPGGGEIYGLRDQSGVSVAIHGTWARLSGDRWYAPEGALHQRMRRDCTPNLFTGDDYFRWTGGYSDVARQQATSDFLRWLSDRRLPELDTVFAHSHGGNVALAAAGEGVRMRLLVLLHVPALVRSPDEWRRIVANIDHVVVMRTRLDYVLLADGLRTGSSQAFSQSVLPHREIMPHVLDKRGWISHDTFIGDRNWAQWNLAREIRYERSSV